MYYQITKEKQIKQYKIIPRRGDVVIIDNIAYEVRFVEFDYDYEEIRVCICI